MNNRILRNLDNAYFRMKINNKWRDVCFSDMTKDEQDEIMKDKNEIWLKKTCKALAKSLRKIGDEFDIIK